MYNNLITNNPMFIKTQIIWTCKQLEQIKMLKEMKKYYKERQLTYKLSPAPVRQILSFFPKTTIKQLTTIQKKQTTNII
jgi:hypothetical protein